MMVRRASASGFGTLCLALALGGAVAAAKTTTLVYTTWLGETTEEKKLLADFTKANPDIKVKLLSIPGGPLGYVEKILTSIIGGASPDVMRINHECIIPLYQAKGLLNLNATIKQSRFDLKDFYDPNVKLFNLDGMQLGIPISFNNYVIYYNRQMTSVVGLPELSQLALGSGWTREAFLGVAKKLTRDTNGDGKNEFWGVGDVPSWLLDAYIRQAGGTWYTADGKKCVFNSPETVDGLSYMWDMRQNLKVWNPASAWDSIWTKKAATQIVSGWAIGYLKQSKVDYDVADVFQYKNPRFMGVSGDGFGIGSGSKKKDAAWKLVRFLTGDAAMTYLTKTGTISPTRISVAKGEAFGKSQEVPRNREAFLRAMDSTVVIEPRFVKNTNAVTAAIDREMAFFYAGKKPPQQTAADLQAAVNRLLGAR